MTDDWVQDSSLSREETLRRFGALSPEQTVGPPTPDDEYDETEMTPEEFRRGLERGIPVRVVTSRP